ncbi:MAG: hypothetical protein ABIU86_07675, partial [Gemmatimonadaceae bacterium]
PKLVGESAGESVILKVLGAVQISGGQLLVSGGNPSFQVGSHTVPRRAKAERTFCRYSAGVRREREPASPMVRWPALRAAVHRGGSRRK